MTQPYHSLNFGGVKNTRHKQGNYAIRKSQIKNKRTSKTTKSAVPTPE